MRGVLNEWRRNKEINTECGKIQKHFKKGLNIWCCISAFFSPYMRMPIANKPWHSVCHIHVVCTFRLFVLPPTEPKNYDDDEYTCFFSFLFQEKWDHFVCLWGKERKVVAYPIGQRRPYLFSFSISSALPFLSLSQSTVTLSHFILFFPPFFSPKTSFFFFLASSV